LNAVMGLFPLGLVLLPGERVPLHIFEERYKELISECLNASSAFGIVLQDSQGVRSIGTSAVIVEVVERFPDGRMNVVVEGQIRFRVDELTEGRSFITARTSPVTDEEQDPVPDPDAVEACLEAYRDVADAVGVTPGDVPAGDQPLSFRIAGQIAFEPRMKQELLELRSEPARVARLTEMLRAAAAIVRRRNLIRKRAAGNGHMEDFG
jgi:Lon protease-like protein